MLETDEVWKEHVIKEHVTMDQEEITREINRFFFHWILTKTLQTCGIQLKHFLEENL